MPIKGAKPEKIQSIGVVMLGLMGDVIMRTPILRELRKAFPQAQITCIVDPIGKEVLQLSELVDDLICTDRKVKGLHYISEKLKLQARVISRRFDLMIDLYGGASSQMLVKLSFAKNWLIVQDFNVESNVAWKERYPVPPPQNPSHLVNGAFEILRFLNYPNKSTDPTPGLREFVQTGQEIGLSTRAMKPSHYLVTLGSGDPRKFIDCDLLTNLAQWLFSEHGLTPRIVRNPGQTELQEELSTSLTTRGIPHVNLEILPLRKLRSELLAAHFLISPDTGLFHFGLSLNVPVLGIFSYTNPKLVMPGHGHVTFCFKEDPNSTVRVDGLPVGMQNPELQDLIASCDLLLKQIESSH